MKSEALINLMTVLYTDCRKEILTDYCYVCCISYIETEKLRCEQNPKTKAAKKAILDLEHARNLILREQQAEKMEENKAKALSAATNCIKIYEPLLKKLMHDLKTHCNTYYTLRNKKSNVLVQDLTLSDIAKSYESALTDHFSALLLDAFDNPNPGLVTPGKNFSLEVKVQEAKITILFNHASLAFWSTQIDYINSLDNELKEKYESLIPYFDGEIVTINKEIAVNNKMIAILESTLLKSRQQFDALLYKEYQKNYNDINKTIFNIIKHTNNDEQL